MYRVVALERKKKGFAMEKSEKSLLLRQSLFLTFQLREINVMNITN